MLFIICLKCNLCNFYFIPFFVCWIKSQMLTVTLENVPVYWMCLSWSELIKKPKIIPWRPSGKKKTQKQNTNAGTDEVDVFFHWCLFKSIYWQYTGGGGGWVGGGRGVVVVRFWQTDFVLSLSQHSLSLGTRSLKAPGFWCVMVLFPLKTWNKTVLKKKN